MRISSERSLRAGFLHHADVRPDHIALTIGRRAYTYAEGADTARRWATRLTEGIGGRPRRVGVFAYRSESSYLGVLAALFAGAAFVPLNRRFPLQRTRAMMEQADLDALIVDEDSLPDLPELLRGRRRPLTVLLPGADVGSLVGSVPGSLFGATDLACAEPMAYADLPPIDADDLAYLLFTSGSTGTPKGVPITHGNARAFLDVNSARYHLTSEDRLTQTFDQTFDLSVFDLFMAWESGARVCSMQPIELLAPYRFLEQNEVTVWFSVPSVASVLSKRGTLSPGRMPTLRWSLFCGEALPRSIAETWQAAAPNSIVENLYGPTELTIACTAYRWDQATSPAECERDLVPIGRPYRGMSPLVVDEDLRPVPAGRTGELCLAGPQRFSGYWGAPQLTIERQFEHEGETYYRTGDLVRLRGDHYVYAGRNDQQVKLGGYRIELGEIEAALRGAGCVEAISMVGPDGDSIVAVVSGADDPATLAKAMGKQLPAYMVPKSVHLIDEMPLNSNGKVDRNALRQWLESQPVPGDPFVDHRGENHEER
ncbi:amino acid adenylation domain-containing protein [Kitasatospora sp. NPDC052896]|uniref:amino acid adenylation domain-containing protein n=1 Tax=Kitasatospora sp. NPDC052896 TaxID=3364061 RepID=UPI0037C697D4